MKKGKITLDNSVAIGYNVVMVKGAIIKAVIIALLGTGLGVFIVEKETSPIMAPTKEVRQ